MNSIEKRYPVLGSTFLKLVMGGLLLLSIVGFICCFVGASYCEQHADLFFHSTPKKMLAEVVGNSIYYDTEMIGASAARKIFLAVHQLKYYFMPLAVLFGLSSVGFFSYLMAAAGRRRYTNEVVPSFLTPIPLDLLLPILPIVFLAFCVVWDPISHFHTAVQRMIVLLFGALYAITAIVLSMDIAVRLKLGKWWKNTVIYRLLRMLYLLVRLMLSNISVFIKGVIFCAVLTVYTFLVMAFQSPFAWLLGLVIAVPFVLYIALVLNKLLKGSSKLAKGKLSEKISTDFMIGDFKKAADNLNSIGNGMNLAVAERMKSERFRTELITNVSHDIKTPLTSIINYSDLIIKEECENEKIKEYAEVLARQSLKLKRLTEDLIEASKAANGMVNVSVAPMESSILLGQVAGEYAEKLKERRLELVLQQEDCILLADGRLMWRILDNLMNNVFKYAQEGTRVYLSCKPIDKVAEITLRNTSQEQLNISAEELMERFVRGDSARASEGNGLGLSIARSFTELQKGSFKIEIDGDLFKTIVRIPLQ